MPLDVSPRTLERLDWSEVAARLARHAATPLGAAALAAPPESLFAASRAEAEARLAETGEARAVLDEGEVPPFEGTADVQPQLERLRRGGALEGLELLAVAGTLRACAGVGRFLRARGERAPGLAALAEALADEGPLALQIERALDPDGSVRDDASPALAAARRDARARQAEVQSRVDRLLKDPALRDALQDRFVTVREGRAVVPVRAEARGRVPGIVHDASASGTTVFIEPQAVVDAGNRLKEADLAAAREARRVLERLGAAVAPHADAVQHGLAVLGRLDLAFARARLAREMDAAAPAIDDAEGRFEVLQLRHPLIAPDEVVPNDLRLGGATRVLVLSGPNAGGKTVAMKALALCPLFAWAGLQIPAAPGSRLPWVERLLGDIGDAQDLRQHLSTFSAHMANLAGIVETADSRSLVVLDEVGVGTDPAEGAALAQAALEHLAEAGALVVATTHYTLLKELAGVDARFANASVEFDPETLAPTYRLRHGAAGHSSAAAVAARMGLSAAVLERADALLAQEDRRLDRLLAELATSRATLERERSEATRLREESEATRDTYRAKLERLQERRDKLFLEMRADLDAAFKDAHDKVAGVIRELQRGGDARDAARARERLLDLERATEAVQARERAKTPPSTPRRKVDWTRARAGDPVALPTGTAATLVALPDRRGRVTVQAGGARMQLEAEKLTPAAGTPALGGAPGAQGDPSADGGAATRTKLAPQRPHVSAPPIQGEGLSRVDLRGLRVDEALPRVDEALDRAARSGTPTLEIVHGLGTGALRRAVRRHLGGVPYALRVEDAGPERGGDGVTLAHLAR